MSRVTQWYDVPMWGTALYPAVHLPIGGQARQIRQKAKISRQELADFLGVHVVSVARWERGTRTPSGGLARQYAVALDRIRKATFRGGAPRGFLGELPRPRIGWQCPECLDAVTLYPYDDGRDLERLEHEIEIHEKATHGID